MKIGLDVMGGDFAPLNIVLGAIEAFPKLQSGTELYLFGNQSKITEICSQKGFDLGNFVIIH